MAVFFTADTHFGHANIIKHCGRPFADAAAMDAALVDNWNAAVGPKDTVYHVGDFAYRAAGPAGDYLDRLNGTIHLVRGNHDDGVLKECGDRFASVSDLSKVRWEGARIILCHYALRVWDGSHKGAWHLYGHTHGDLPDDPASLSFDVGVDCHDYRPLSFAEVAEKMTAKMRSGAGPAGGHGG